MRNILFVFVSVAFIACGSGPSVDKKLEGTKLPPFSLLLMDSLTRFESNKLVAKKPVVLLFLSPTCPTCRAQTQDILSNIEALKDIQFCIMTYVSFTEFKSFYKEFQLEKYSNVVAGIDDANFFIDYFKAELVPCTAIYNNNKKLNKVLIGAVDYNRIKDIALD